MVLYELQFAGLFLLFGENELHEMHHVSIANGILCSTFCRFGPKRTLRDQAMSLVFDLSA